MSGDLMVVKGSKVSTSALASALAPLAAGDSWPKTETRTHESLDAECTRTRESCHSRVMSQLATLWISNVVYIVEYMYVQLE